MDNMDGKQARRTGTSSALGMLFDHACDAVNTGLVGTVAVGISMRVGLIGSGTFLGLLVFTTVPFYFIAWEE
jgi:ethanolaminephosphotransferase